jgi:hypothetical protein
MKSIAVVACLAAFAGASAQELYKPESRDVIEIWRNDFGTRNFEKGKEAYMKHAFSTLDRDGLVRMTVVGENRRTGELVTVQFSDPFNLSRASTQHGSGSLQQLLARPAARHEFEIFTIVDEGVVPQVGDKMFFYWRHVKPEGHQEFQRELGRHMSKALTDAPAKWTSYMAHAEGGTFLNVAFGRPAPTEHPLDRRLDHVKHLYLRPREVEEFSVIAVRMEHRL